MNLLSHILGKYFLLSLLGQQLDDDNYCYSTDKTKAQQKHYTLQTKHDKYINKLENTMSGKQLNIFLCIPSYSFFLKIFFIFLIT